MKDLKKLANQCMAELDAIGVKYGKVVAWEVTCGKLHRNFNNLCVTCHLLYPGGGCIL